MEKEDRMEKEAKKLKKNKKGKNLKKSKDNSEDDKNEDQEEENEKDEDKTKKNKKKIKDKKIKEDEENEVKKDNEDKIKVKKKEEKNEDDNDKIKKKRKNNTFKNREYKNKDINEANDLNNIKVCLCTQAKGQNKYIREYVKFYKKMGVDKIIIYDNNDKDGEKLDDVIDDYISKKFVVVKNHRGKKKVLLKMMNDCYQKNKNNYDWIIFYSTNEYIHLNNYTNIKNFLNEEKFKKCDKIYLNWVYHTDNNLYHYEKKPVQLRFPQTEPKPKFEESLKHNYVRSIIRGNLEDIKINSIYKLVGKIKGCNALGEFPEMELYTMDTPDFDNYYIDLYFSKSVDEFIEELNEEDMLKGDDPDYKIEKFENYFKSNDMTIKKIEYIEKKTNLDLTKFKNKLIEQKQKNKLIVIKNNN